MIEVLNIVSKYLAIGAMLYAISRMNEDKVFTFILIWPATLAVYLYTTAKGILRWLAKRVRG